MTTGTTYPGGGNILSGNSNIYGDGTTSSSQGANTVVHFYDRAGIKAANRVNVYGQFADRKSMPKKMGKTFKISKFMHMYDRAQNDGEFAAKGFLSHRSVAEVNTALSGAALAEGAGAVNQRTLQKITMDTAFARYGEMIDYTDEIELFSEDTIQVRYREELGELANSRMEDLIQLDLLSTGTVVFQGSATNMAEIDEASVATYDMIRSAVRKLVRNRAKKNTSMVTGSVKIDTRTVAKAFYAVIGANVKGDMESLVRGNTTDNGTTEYVYIPVHKYAAAGNMAEGEVGAMHEVRFIEAESAVVYAGQGAATDAGGAADGYAGPLSFTTYASAAAAETARGAGNVWDRLNDVYDTAANAAANSALEYFDAFPILLPTEGCFATIGLKGQGKIKFHSKAPDQVELSNPYGTQGFFSYNFWYAGLILQEEKLLKILVSASA
jgi:N4-gp56 family major capsid protein